MSTITATTIKALVPEVQVLADSVEELDSLQDNHAAALLELQLLVREQAARIEELEAWRLRSLNEAGRLEAVVGQLEQALQQQQPATSKQQPANRAPLSAKQVLNANYPPQAAQRLRALHPALHDLRVLEDLPNVSWRVTLGEVEIWNKLPLKEFVKRAEANPDGFLAHCEKKGVKFPEPGSFDEPDEEAGLPPECPY